MHKSIKVGDYVLVKHEFNIKSPISAHRTHQVLEVYPDNTLLLKGYPERLPTKMFDRIVIRKYK